MNFLELATVLLLLASIFSIINLRLLKLPQTIGLMVLAIVLSAVVLFAGLIAGTIAFVFGGKNGV